MSDQSPINSESSESERSGWCVWAAAGLAAPMHCCFQFACDQCEIDRSMRRTFSRPPGAAATAAAGARDWLFPADRSYHPAHAWAQPTSGRRCRIGIDAFLSHLIDHVGNVILLPRHSRVEQDQPGAWLGNDAGLFPVRMPVSGSIALCNTALTARPALCSHDPYHDGWLLEVLREEEDALDLQLMTAEAMRRRTDRQWAAFSREVRQRLARGRSAVGPTLADGGETVETVRRQLGAGAYRKLIMKVM